MLKLDWKEGRYNSSQAQVGKLLSLSVNWDNDTHDRTTTKTSGYRWSASNGTRSRILYPSMTEAKAKAEEYIYSALLLALEPFKKEQTDA